MNNPFDRYTIRTKTPADSELVNRQFGQGDRSLRFLLEHMLAPRLQSSSQVGLFRPAFFGDALRVRPVNPVAMQVVVGAGLGFYYDTADVPSNLGAPDYLGVHDLAPVKPLPLVAPVTFNVPTAPGAPNTRVDIIEVRADRRFADTDSAPVFDDATESFVPNTVTTSLAFALDGDTGTVSSPANSTAGLSYKIGTAGNPGAIPATTPGYIKIANVNVGSAVVSIGEMDIDDNRVIAAPGGVVQASASFHSLWNGGAPSVSLSGLSAPPGVSAGSFVSGGAQRATIQIGFTGGLIKGGHIIATAAPTSGTTQGATIAYVIGWPTNVAYSAPLNGTTRNLFAAGGAPLKAGPNQPYLFGEVEVWAADVSGNLTKTPVALEDVNINVIATLLYDPF